MPHFGNVDRPYDVLRVVGRVPVVVAEGREIVRIHRRKSVPIKGSEFELECDLCIVAVGSGANPLLTQTTPDLQMNQWGFIGDDWEGSGYDEDAMRAAIDGYNEHLATLARAIEASRPDMYA